MGRMNILEEADDLTSGDRAERYGDALTGARKFAMIARSATGARINPEDFPLIMIAMKLSRVKAGPTDKFPRDTYVDIAGYCRVAELIQEGLAAERDELSNH